VSLDASDSSDDASDMVDVQLHAEAKAGVGDDGKMIVLSLQKEGWRRQSAAGGPSTPIL
jgi:hypothetical protein